MFNKLQLGRTASVWVSGPVFRTFLSTRPTLVPGTRWAETLRTAMLPRVGRADPQEEILHNLIKRASVQPLARTTCCVATQRLFCVGQLPDLLPGFVERCALDVQTLTAYVRRLTPLFQFRNARLSVPQDARGCQYLRLRADLTRMLATTHSLARPRAVPVLH